MANPEHLERLLGGVESWNLWRSSRDLHEVDLRGADLSGRDLRCADLWYARLQGADLSSCLLSGATLVRADLTLADLTNASLFQVNLRGALLDRSVLKGAALVECDLTLAKVTRADLDGAIFTESRVLGANFFGSDLEPALGLNRSGGFIVEESGVPHAERHSIDLRDEMFGALRRSGSP